MSTTYWDQWNQIELMSMHGLEITDQEEDQEEEIEDEENQQGCCSGCMSCLGFSWSDFI